MAAGILMTLSASILLLDDKPMIGKTSFTTKNDNFYIPVNTWAVESRHDKVLRSVSDIEKDSIVLEHTIHL